LKPLSFTAVTLAALSVVVAADLAAFADYVVADFVAVTATTAIASDTSTSVGGLL
jgi:hypothetical protein